MKKTLIGKTKKNTKHDMSESINCVICLENLDAKKEVLECKHAFHSSCIAEWMRKHTTCPTCRVTMTDEAISSILTRNNMTKELIDFDEDSEDFDDEMTMLQHAIERGTIDNVRDELLMGSPTEHPFEIENGHGMTAMEFACKLGKTQVISRI